MSVTFVLIARPSYKYEFGQSLAVIVGMRLLTPAIRSFYFPIVVPDERQHFNQALLRILEACPVKPTQASARHLEAAPSAPQRSVSISLLRLKGQPPEQPR